MLTKSKMMYVNADIENVFYIRVSGKDLFSTFLGSIKL